MNGGGKTRILIVDDTPEIANLLARMLTNENREAVPFFNGGMLLGEAVNQPPDLIIIDINMPDMNGYELCNELKKQPRLGGVPVIFLSSYHDIENKMRAFSMGGVDFITKPFQIEEVEARVDTHLKILGMQRELKEYSLELESNLSEIQNMNLSLQKANSMLELQSSRASLLFEMLESLQTVSTEKDVWETARSFSNKLMPDSSGAAYFPEGPAEQYKKIFHWGGFADEGRPFRAAGCRALQEGKIHFVDPDAGVAELPDCRFCNETSNNGSSAERITHCCVPLEVAGGKPGLFHVRHVAPDNTEGKAVLNLKIAVH